MVRLRTSAGGVWRWLRLEIGVALVARKLYENIEVVHDIALSIIKIMELVVQGQECGDCFSCILQ